eukprot:SRR837773.22294.p1 GENE.SRR837773.22294~~SRR837773.22294.p1  ORF type:complete len:452 (+),score=141.82 SRR837773.22294:40-1356(+)
MAGCLLCGALNNVGSAMTSIEMFEFPSFLNYWVSFLSAIAFLAIAKHQGENVFETLSPKWRAAHPGEALRLHIIFYLLSWVTAANWIPTEYSAAWVSGNYQQVLTGLSPAFVMLLSRLLLGSRFSLTEVASSFIVIAGGFVAFVPYLFGTQDGGDQGVHKPWFNSWYFIAVYLLSSFAFALECVCQEHVYKQRPTLGIATTQFWVQLYAIPLYMVATFLEMLPQVTGSVDWQTAAYVLNNQSRAFQCFFGTAGDAMCRSHTPLKWFSWYIAGFAGSYYFNGRLMRQTTAFWTLILQALTTPLAAVVFGIKPIVGPEGYAPFTLWTLLAFVMMLFGVVMRGTPRELDEAMVSAGALDPEVLKESDNDTDEGPMKYRSVGPIPPTIHESTEETTETAEASSHSQSSTCENSTPSGSAAADVEQGVSSLQHRGAHRTGSSP